MLLGARPAPAGRKPSSAGPCRAEAASREVAFAGGKAGPTARQVPVGVWAERAPPADAEGEVAASPELSPTWRGPAI